MVRDKIVCEKCVANLCVKDGWRRQSGRWRRRRRREVQNQKQGPHTKLRGKMWLLSCGGFLVITQVLGAALALVASELGRWVIAYVAMVLAFSKLELEPKRNMKDET